MERPSDFWQLIQAYVVIAIGVLALIVMADAKTRRDQENRMSLILGYNGKYRGGSPRYCPKTQSRRASAAPATHRGVRRSILDYPARDRMLRQANVRLDREKLFDGREFDDVSTPGPERMEHVTLSEGMAGCCAY